MDSLRKIPTTTCMHCLLGKLLLHYKACRNAANLRVSCLAEVMVSYIFRGLLCKTFPLGCITFGEIKNVCLSAGQSERIRWLSSPVFCLDRPPKYPAYSCKSRPREKAVRAADRPHNFQRNHNLQKRKDGGEKKGVVVNKREKSWSARDN